MLFFPSAKNGGAKARAGVISLCKTRTIWSVELCACVWERERVCVCERTGPYTCFSTPLINNLCFSIMSMCVWEYVWERECVCVNGRALIKACFTTPGEINYNSWNKSLCLCVCVWERVCLCVIVNGQALIKGIVHFEIIFWYVLAYLKGIQDAGVFVSTVFSILTQYFQLVNCPFKACFSTPSKMITMILYVCMCKCVCESVFVCDCKRTGLY